MLKSINEESGISSEREINLDKTSNERSESTKSDTPSTGLNGPSNKSSTTITSSENSGVGAVWIFSETSMMDTPNGSNGEARSN